MPTATCATSTGGSQRLYSGRILDADGIVAVTAELDWPVNRTAVRTGGTDATAWADAVEAFLFADGHTACVYARVGADDDITEVLTARGFAEMATLPGNGLRNQPRVARRSRRLSGAPGRVRR